MIEQLPHVLTLDCAGTPHKWIDYQQYCYYKCKDLILWSMGENEYELHGGTNAKTGLRSTLMMNSIIAIKGHKLKDSHVLRTPALTNRTLFKRDKYTCAQCLNTLDKKFLSREHLLPLSRGGKNVWENVITFCKKCNHAKGNMTMPEAEEIGLKLHFIPYKISHFEHLILSGRNVLQDQMLFLLDRVPKHSRLFT